MSLLQTKGKVSLFISKGCKSKVLLVLGGRWTRWGKGILHNVPHVFLWYIAANYKTFC